MFPFFWVEQRLTSCSMVHILAAGVFFTGFIKDLLSLPRPLSPPLHRITMSGSAALEYGFPSTHSANAVSVAVYALFTLHSPECTLQPTTKLLLEGLSYCYALSIVLGRLYCGMHGFFDVIIGCILGALFSVLECVYGETMDQYLYSSDWTAPLVRAAIIIALVRIHPEPADDCPCFDDSVAFAAVWIGCELGGWHFANGGRAWDAPVPATVPFNLEQMGWLIVIVRVVVGVLTIFAWREVMKPTLLKVLPHIFRIVEKLGLSLPRKFFKPASEYKQVPPRLRDDNVMPSVSDLPQLLNSIRHPRRGRAVSVGPQSAADAYETLAYREKRRKESASSISRPTLSPENQSYFTVPQSSNGEVRSSLRATGVSSYYTNGNLPTPAPSNVGSYEEMMGQGTVVYTPATPPQGLDEGSLIHRAYTVPDQRKGHEERDVFYGLEKPRVRYDVEVVTKLIVYTGKKSSQIVSIV